MPLPTATREGRVAVTSGLRVQVAVGAAAPGGSAARKSCVSLGRRLRWTLRAPLAEPRSLLPLPSPASFPPAGSPVTERTGVSTQLGTWSPSWSWGPSRTFLEAQHRVFGAASPLSPSHPLTAPRPLPPALPPGRSSRPSCRRLLKLHVFHFSDVFDCTAVFFLFLCLRLLDAEPLRAATLPYSWPSSWGPARWQAPRALPRLRGANDQATDRTGPARFTGICVYPAAKRSLSRDWPPGGRAAVGTSCPGAPLRPPSPASHPHCFIHVPVISRSGVPPDSCLEPVDVRGGRDQRGIWYRRPPSRNRGRHFLSCSRVLDPPQSWTPGGGELGLKT